MDLGLKGRTAVVTGGSKGIGLACAIGFAAEGCSVHLVARDQSRLEAARERIRAAHPVEVWLHAADLRDGAAVKRVAAACRDADILVNNAGDIPGGSVLDIDEATWRHAWDLKVFGYLNMTREMLAQMKERGRGAIVNVIGMAGEKPSFEYVCGATANAGLAAFTKGVGQKSTQFGVRCVAVHPPATRTDRIVALMRNVARQKYGDESRVDEVVKDGGFGRIIEPEQVADTVVYLASERAGHLSGIVLNLGA
ncbi:MAG: SDR family NAD(P)-dependent oxidoreductase [Burkholderiales bacterium]|nr:SDR family NAD(P)-dependent oxidoreductase [Burkholderiales bacterium]